MSLKAIHRKALAGDKLSDTDIRYILHLPDERLGELLMYAHCIRLEHFNNKTSLCAIVNAKSGTCSEDCIFCAQSGHYQTNAPEHPLLSALEIAEVGTLAKTRHAHRIGIVCSGKTFSGKNMDVMTEAVRRLVNTGLEPDISPGILDRTQLKLLKKAGLAGYHHNLETSAGFFPHICTTHAYDEDVNAVRDAIKEGVYVCSGGIFGIGETWEDRVELALLLSELGVHSVPINFLQPIPGTPLEHRPVLTPEEALRITALYRFLLPDRALRICGGRLAVFGHRRKSELLTSGADGIMIGDYLTTKGGDAQSDMQDIATSGLVVENGRAL